MGVDHWFMHVEKILEAMEITSDTTRIRLAAFQLEVEAQVWWNWAKFHDLFMGKYFQDTDRHTRAMEFLQLK